MLPDEPSRSQPEGASGLPGCYRHPERETGITCARCGRPICPECMVSASVGFQCPECVAGGRAEVREPRTRFGGVLGGDGALVTKILIGINVVVFVLTAYVRPAWYSVLCMYSYPGDARFAAAGLAVGPHEWYRVVSAVFVHNGPFHIGMNMVSLWVIGPQLERVLGRLRYLGLYLVSGVAGNAFVYLVGGGSLLISAGASGAIFGLLGATAVLFRANRVPLGPVIALLVFNLVITFSVPQIDWRAHVGGLLAGLVTGAGLMYAPRARRNLVQGLTVAGMLTLIVVTLVVETARLGG